MKLVTGATGNVGRELVDSLLVRDVGVRAVVRDATGAAMPDAAESVTADLESPETLTTALRGIDGVFLLGGWGDMPGILHQVRQAGVERVVLLSSRCVIGGRPDNPVMGMWLDSERAVRESGVAWSVLRASGFQSNALRWLPQLREGDVVRAPWPDVPIAAIDPADIAAVAATVLTESGHGGMAYTLSGPAPLTPGEQVATLAAVLERPLRYEPLSDGHARSEMAETTPAAYVDAFFRFYSDGEFDDSAVVDTVQQLTGDQPRTFMQWAQAHAEDFSR
jgi:uncharacterized protein YbjT (DUF2867 family)